MIDFYFAPVQGHTDAPYRHFHNLLYKGAPIYTTPFIRLENGALRQRDIKDFKADINGDMRLIPQIIFRDEEELTSLVKKIKELGATEINLNMGCPFPLQTGHGRGAATVANRPLADSIAKIVSDNPDIHFSVKMRLGFSDKDEWKNLLPVLNKISLDGVAVHPRIAKQQYSGDLHLDAFKEIMAVNQNPTIFNGDITTPSDIDMTLSNFHRVKGIMIGRGLLARPSLIEEYLEGEEWPKETRIEKMLTFHRHLLEYYSSVLCVENQILSKIKPFWEYAEAEIGRKAWKNIKKSSNMAKYNSAVASI